MTTEKTKVKEFFRWMEYSWHNSDIDVGKIESLTGGVDVESVSSQAVVLADDQILAFSNIRTDSSSPNSTNKAR